MSFQKTKSCDNRTDAKTADCINGRTWSRRAQWLENEHGQVKIKFEDTTVNPPVYKECLFDGVGAKVAWQRFKDGQPIDECVSIYGSPVPEALKSKKAE